MKVSIVIPVLNSHEVVRRQLLHFLKMPLPEDVELILVDDGSDPPLAAKTRETLNLYILRTHDTRPWTWAPARNAGARVANGDYLLMTDVDHILSRALIDDVRAFRGDKMQFKREFAVLDEYGEFRQDVSVLLEYGLLPERVATQGVKVKPLPNNFAMRRDLFFEIGGYRENRIGGRYPQGEDRLFKKEWLRWERKGLVKVHHERPTIYMFPNGQFCGDVDYNPFGLFHGLSRKTERNHWHKKLLAGERR